MSGLIVIAFAALLMQETTRNPSTQAAYQAPVVRPFEPGPELGRERAEGDAGADRHRRPLEAPVTVEAYARSYEYTPDDLETAYEQGVISAEIRADQAAGPLDGVWRIVDASGRTRYDLVLIDPGVGPAEGGWRDGTARGAATSDGASLTLDGAGVVALERAGAGWRGVLTVDDRRAAVILIRPN